MYIFLIYLTQLTEACKEGNVGMVNMLLASSGLPGRPKLDINFKDLLLERTPLMWASEAGHEQVVKRLLQCDDIQVGLADNTGWQAIHYSARAGHAKVTGMLLDKGADINVRKSDGYTPLMLSALNDQNGCVELLLRRGAEVEWQGDKSPIKLAREQGNIGVVILLEDCRRNPSKYKGVQSPLRAASTSSHMFLGDVNAKEGMLGATKLMKASEEGKTQAVQKLLQCDGIEVGIADRLGFQAIHHAAKGGHADILRMLIDKGADMNVKKFDGYTPLMLCALNDHVACVELLLRKGADVKWQGEQSPLHLARSNGSASALKLLEEFRRNPDKYQNPTSSTDEQDMQSALAAELMKACLSGDTLSDMLLGRGATGARSVSNINDQDHRGLTKLMMACEMGHTHVVKQLLQVSNIDIELANREGWRAIHICSKKDQVEILDLLIKRGADVNVQKKDLFSPLMLAAFNDNQQVAKRLLQVPTIKVALANKEGWQAIHFSARRGNLEVTNLLLAKGANVNAKMNDGCTPLILASMNNNLKLTSRLLDHKDIDISLGENDGMQAIHYAARGGHTDVMRLLINKGADVNIKKQDGFTPLMLAALNDQKHSAELLLRRGAEVSGLGAKSPMQLALSKGNGSIMTLLADYQKNPHKYRSSPTTSPEQNTQATTKVSPPKLSKLLNQDIYENEGAVFEVRITGEPEPVVTWYRNNVELKPSDRIMTSSGDGQWKLRLRHCKAEESGIITVKAVNKAGEQKTEARLTVNGWYIINQSCVCLYVSIGQAP